MLTAICYAAKSLWANSHYSETPVNFLFEGIPVHMQSSHVLEAQT